MIKVLTNEKVVVVCQLVGVIAITPLFILASYFA